MESEARFPFLDDHERDLILGYEQGRVEQSAVVKLMLRLSDDFRAASSCAERATVRAKLLGLAGLYEVVPVELFEQAKNAPLSLNLLELQIDQGEEIMRALIRCGEVPFDVLVNLPEMRDFFAVKRPDHSSYHQYLLKKNSELGGVLVIVKDDISQEMNLYVSASSEPLTRSILVSPWVEAGKKELRDLASVAYDLVMQIEFLDIYYRSRSVLDRRAIQGAMRIEGLKFILDVFALLLERAVKGKLLEIDITAAQAVLKNKAGAEGGELCRYLKYLLYGLAANAAVEITQVLGLQTAEIEIGKILLERSIGFDFRRVEMLIE